MPLAARPSPGRATRPELHCHSRRTSLSFVNMALLDPVTDAARVRDHGFHQIRVSRVVPETAEASSFVLDVPDRAAI